MELKRCKDDSCRQKIKQKQEELYQSSKENGKVIASVGVDLTPVAGDFKSFAEAEDRVDYDLFPFFSTGGNEFYEYNYTRTIEVTQVVTTKPGVIQSGADLTINSDKLLNKDSRIRRADC